MVRQVEELGAELRSEALADASVLEDGEIEVSEVRPPYDVPSGVAKGEQFVQAEGVRVEKALDRARSRVRVADQIRTVIAFAGPAVVRAGQYRKGLPSLQRQNASEFPAVRQNCGGARQKPLQGELVDVAAAEPMPDVEIRKPALPGPRVEIVLREDRRAVRPGA